MEQKKTNKTVANNLINETQSIVTENKNLLEQVDKLTQVNDKLQCTANKVDDLVIKVVEQYVSNGTWVSIKWYEFGKWINLGKLMFTFIKSTLKECYETEFNPRTPSWFEKVLGK
jgi:hypothetical protein